MKAYNSITGNVVAEIDVASSSPEELFPLLKFPCSPWEEFEQAVIKCYPESYVANYNDLSVNDKRVTVSSACLPGYYNDTYFL